MGQVELTAQLLRANVLARHVVGTIGGGQETIAGRIPFVVIGSVQNPYKVLALGSQHPFKPETQAGLAHFARVSWADGGNRVGSYHRGLKQIAAAIEFQVLGGHVGWIKVEQNKVRTVKLALKCQI